MRSTFCIFGVATVIAVHGCVEETTDWFPPNENDVSIVLQRHDNDCGIAALATLIGLVGGNGDYDDLSRGLAETSRGLSMHALVLLARDRGFDLTGYRFAGLSVADEHARPTPWIALLGSGVNGHYVVVRSVIEDTVFALDPLKGSRSIKRRSFEDVWTGYALLLDSLGP